MPPDADKLRLRKSSSAKDDPTESTAAERICSISKLKDSEVAIDGIIYDLEGFVHPGGDTIMMFGGNDVTVQYNMIHPYHTEKHLQKMKRVGKVTDYHADYKFDTEFEREIKREVFKIVRRGKEFGTWGWWFRAICYVALFFYLQYQWVTVGTSVKLALIYGVSKALIGMNVQHDANHGASSKNPFWNDLMGLGADLIGGSKWLWIEQHWTHHAYTNHASKDPDSFGAEPMVLFNDYPLDHPARGWMHKLQAFYLLPVLAGYWVSSVFNPQILDLQQRGAQGIGMNLDTAYIRSRRKYAHFWRILYIVTNIVVPFYRQGLTLTVFAHIMLMGMSESVALAALFALSHNFENADRDPTFEARKTGEPVDWFKSQVETSCTYGGAISGYLTGGLNFQVEHHLFPRMSSGWYPYIAPKIREICAKHGVKYAYYPWILQNFASTFKYMHEVGNGSNWHMENPLTGRA